MEPKGLNARLDLPHGSEIAALGYAYPSERVDNETFFKRCKFPITDDKAALIAETQMKTRRWCRADENTWTMAKKAVAMCFERAPQLREEIDVVVVASGTTMPVLHAPEKDNAGVADLAPLVLRDFGLENVLGVDIKACYCTGFLRGVQAADAMLANSNYRAALVVATECGSRFSTAETNRSTFCFIMSDAAGAAVLRRTRWRAESGIVDYVGFTDATKHDWVGIGPDAASTIMKGSRAGQATHEMLVSCGKQLLERNGLTPRDVQWLVPIQTHARVVDAARDALNFPREKLIWAGDVTGFSGSASIPAALAEHFHKGVIKKGQLVLSIAVGAGMNCAGALYHA